MRGGEAWARLHAGGGVWRESTSRARRPGLTSGVDAEVAGITITVLGSSDSSAGGRYPLDPSSALTDAGVPDQRPGGGYFNSTEPVISHRPFLGWEPTVAQVFVQLLDSVDKLRHGRVARMTVGHHRRRKSEPSARSHLHPRPSASPYSFPSPSQHGGRSGARMSAP